MKCLIKLPPKKFEKILLCTNSKVSHTEYQQLSQLTEPYGIMLEIKGLDVWAGLLAGRYQYHAVLTIEVDREAELKRLNEELAYFVGFVSSVEKKLSNEKFVANAHPDVVEKERQKKADGESKIEQLQKSIAQLN